jgi:hypothetical protein
MTRRYKRARKNKLAPHKIGLVVFMWIAQQFYEKFVVFTIKKLEVISIVYRITVFELVDKNNKRELPS